MICSFSSLYLSSCKIPHPMTYKFISVPSINTIHLFKILFTTHLFRNSFLFNCNQVGDFFCPFLYPLEQGSPSPGPWTSTGPVRKETESGAHWCSTCTAPPPSHSSSHCLPQNRSLVPKKLGTTALELLSVDT